MNHLKSIISMKKDIVVYKGKTSNNITNWKYLRCSNCQLSDFSRELGEPIEYR